MVQKAWMGGVMYTNQIPCHSQLEWGCALTIRSALSHKLDNRVYSIQQKLFPFPKNLANIKLLINKKQKSQSDLCPMQGNERIVLSIPSKTIDLKKKQISWIFGRRQSTWAKVQPLPPFIQPSRENFNDFNNSTLKSQVLLWPYKEPQNQIPTCHVWHLITSSYSGG